MNEPTDEELLGEHLAGRGDRFEILVRRYSRELYHFLSRFMGNSAAAEDIVQEAFLQVHLAAASFDPRRRFKPWLFTIAANKARDWLRSRSRRPEMPLDARIGGEAEEGQRFSDVLADLESAPIAELEGQEERELVRSVVRQMPLHLREVLVLAYYHRFPYRDMAEILGVPLGTVKSRLHAAVGHFGKQFRNAAASRNGSNPTG